MNLLKYILADIRISISDESLEKFKVFYEELVNWNERFNLTAITDKEKVIVKHFYDSLLAVNTKGWTGDGALVDIGTGAGFPGVPLKIINPKMTVTLIDSTVKKTIFLKNLIARLELNGVEVVQGRVEEIARREEYRGNYDFAVVRAVAGMPVLLEYGLPLLKLRGKLIIYKGPDWETEFVCGKEALDELGGAVIEVYKTKLPYNEGERVLITIEKTKETPARYPRRPGVPEKKPILKWKNIEK